MIFIRPNPAFYNHCATTRSPSCGDKKKSCESNNNSSTRPGNRVILEKTPLHRNDNKEFTTLSMDVAGFVLDDIKIELEDHILTVLAERTNKLGDTFVARRRFVLDADVYDEENIAANLEEDGVLELKVTKKPEAKPRQIPIRTATTGSLTTTTEDKKNADDAVVDESTTETGTKEDDPSPVGLADQVLEESVSVETVDQDDDDDNELNDNGSTVTSDKNNAEAVDTDDNWEEVVKA